MIYSYAEGFVFAGVLVKKPELDGLEVQKDPGSLGNDNCSAVVDIPI